MGTKVVAKNQVYTVHIEDISNEGLGVGKIDGFAIFVENGIPGDIAEVLVTKLKKTYGYGKIMELKKPSDHRSKPPCEVFAQCGGCSLQHMSYEAQLAYKQKKIGDCLQRIGGLQGLEVCEMLGMELPYFYRNKAQFPAAIVEGKFQFGMFAVRSHTVIPVKKCLLVWEGYEEIVAVVESFAQRNKIGAYDEATHTGLIRHILLKAAFQTGEKMVCLVINGVKLPNQNELIRDLTKHKDIVSIAINQNREKTNVIMGKKTETIWGAESITDRIDDLIFHISPTSFFQVNPTQTKKLYDKALVLANPSREETILDIYCGIGTISLYMARYAKKVYGVEIVPSAIEDARKNAESNAIENVEFLLGEAEKIIPRLIQERQEALHTIIVDPPRKGCDSRVLEAIAASGANKVVYISCDPATLARDLVFLCGESGGYEVVEVCGVDCFPMTWHVESVVLLTRSS